MALHRLPHAPLDGITQIRFAPARTNLLLVSSWDSHVRLYDVNSNRLIGLKKFPKAVLDCTFLQETSRFLSVGLDKRVVACDFQTQQEFEIGQHDEAIRCVEYHPATMQVFTGSWDGTLRAWDPRRPQKPTQYVSLGAKVFCMDVSDNKVIVGGSDRHVHIHDMRKMNQPIDRRESSLKFQIRSLKANPKEPFFASGSVEGRVAIEYLDERENMQSRYMFKCHRKKEANGDEAVHRVNAMAFHPTQGTFATGGSDGGVYIWDGAAKKRLWKMDPFSTDVTSLSFSADGTMLAIGVSDLEPNEKIAGSTVEIVVRPVSETEMAPKVNA